MHEYSVTVVIPTYNRAAMLVNAIESVQRQTFPATEIIVVDDGSTDHTAKIMQQQFASVTYIKTHHAGVSSARNIGIKNANSEWIAFLDSDDEWSEKKLQYQILNLQQNPNYLLCHTDEIWVRNGVRVNPMQKHKKRGGHIYRHCLPLCAISPSTAIIHRSIFDTIGLFDVELPACEDYDLWLRICAIHPTLYQEEKLVTRYAGHNDQLSSQHWGMDRFRVSALEKILIANTLNLDNRQLTINMLLKKCSVLIKGGEKRGNIELVEHYEQLVQSYS